MDFLASAAGISHSAAIAHSCERGSLTTGSTVADLAQRQRLVIPERATVQKVKHHAALLYGELPACVAALKAEEGLGAAAMRFVILTAVRAGEAISATREEFNLDEEIWTIPSERTKTSREHRAPLS